MKDIVLVAALWGGSLCVATPARDQVLELWEQGLCDAIKTYSSGQTRCQHFDLVG